MNPLALEDVWFGYGAEPVLRGVSLVIPAGQAVALLGRNGAGKTTLTRLIAALLQPARGAVRVSGRSTRGLMPEDLADLVGYVFQHADQQLFSRTVADEVAFAPRQLGRDAGVVQARVDTALEAVGLGARREAHPYDLPPAERKLVALAAALAQEPRILVLDEPTQGMDRTAVSRVTAVVRAFAQAGGAVVAVTHDLGFVAETLERTLVLDAGVIVADAPTRTLVGDGARARALGLVPPVTAQVSAALDLPGAPVRLAEVVEGLRRIL